MTIQKKSLINSLNTTKKALVASTPVAGSASAATVKPGRQHMASAKAGNAKLGSSKLASAKLASAKFASAKFASPKFGTHIQ